MTTRKSNWNLDGRDELLIGIIAAFIPLVTLGAMVA